MTVPYRPIRARWDNACVHKRGVILFRTFGFCASGNVEDRA